MPLTVQLGRARFRPLGSAAQVYLDKLTSPAADDQVEPDCDTARDQPLPAQPRIPAVVAEDAVSIEDTDSFGKSLDGVGVVHVSSTRRDFDLGEPDER